MNLQRLNTLSPTQAHEALLACCGAQAWVTKMTAARPFADEQALRAAAEQAFNALTDADWRQAFEHHPRIGDLDSLRARLTGNRQWSASEQSGAAAADERTLEELAAGNDEYLRRFGYTFIVCATGKSAAEMLAILRRRLHNDPRLELQVAAGEQRKITALRLGKLLSP